MAKCKKCGTTFDGNFCPSCGTQFKKRKWLIPVIVVSSILFLGIFSAVFSTITLNNDLKTVQTCISHGNYAGAKKILDDNLDIQKSEEKLYIAYADFYLAQDDVIGAVNILEKGLDESFGTKNIQNKLNELNDNYSEIINTYKAEQADAAKKAAEEQAEADRKAAEEAAKEEERKKQEAAAQQQKSKEDYMASCQTIDYKTLARNPDKYKGQSFKFTGEVMQVIEPTFGNTVTLLISVTKNPDIDIYTDNIYATVSVPDGVDRILEDDIITFYGDCEGMYNYESLLGQKISLPKISIKYYAVQ